MPTFPKIITKLRERRQIEADLREILTASSEPEFQQEAQRIAALGSQVIPAIVDNLDQADARMLTVLGAVSTFLDREQISAALRRTIRQPHRTDEERVGAMTILERYLGESLPDDLLANLSDPERVAITSLEKVLSQAASNPTVLIDHIQGLDRQEPDVVLSVASALQDMGSSEQALLAVEPLRMMAQDVRDEIAAYALQALGTIRLTQAAEALQSLVPIVGPELGHQAERSLRRLRFIGVKINELPPPEPDWRALVSPIDGLGRQSLWFIQENRWTEQVRFLNVLLNDRAGAVESVGYNQVPMRMLPPRRLCGYVHDIALPDRSGAMLMLEVSFDLGRRLVLDALAQNRRTQIPVAGPLRLLSPWLWGVSGADSLPERVLPESSAANETFFAESDRLLDYPAFASWTAGLETTFQAADKASRHPGWDREVWVRRLVGEFLGEESVVGAISQRLVSMSEWLLLAGEDTQAQRALLVADSMVTGNKKALPFVNALIQRDLEVALHSLTQEPILGTE